MKQIKMFKYWGSSKRPLATGLLLAAVLLFAAILLLSTCATRLSYDQVRHIHPPEQPWPDSIFFDSGNSLVHGRLARAHEPVKGHILLLHGLAGSTWSWHLLTPQLQKAGYTVLALDIPPFGFSANESGDFRSSLSAGPAFADILRSVYDGPWILGGHSMGGRYVSRLALQYPQLTTALLLFDGAVLPDRQRNAGNRLTTWFTRQFLEYSLRRPASLRRFLKDAYAQTPDDDALFAYAAPFSQPGKIAALSTWASQPAPEPALDLSQLSMPVLLLWGERDSWVPPGNAYTIQNSIPHASLIIIPDAGHNPMETHPEATWRAVHDFLLQLEK